MIHARKDYDRIQDPAVNDPSLLSEGSTPIGENEPVFLIRAKDICAQAALIAWADELELHEGDQKLIDHVREWAKVMEKWRVENGGKIPDVAPELLKL